MRFFSITSLLITLCQLASAQDQGWPTFKNTDQLVAYSTDWLVTPTSIKAEVYSSSDKQDIILYNGLVKRVFRISPNVACIDFKNLSTGQQLLRAVKPEASLVIDGKSYSVGGLYGQKENAYLMPDWVSSFTAYENDFQFETVDVKPITPFIQWKATTWLSNKKQATGKVASFTYRSKLSELEGLKVIVNYEIYDGLP